MNLAPEAAPRHSSRHRSRQPAAPPLGRKPRKGLEQPRVETGPMANLIRRPEEPQRLRLTLFYSSLCEWNKSSRLTGYQHAKWLCALIPSETKFMKRLKALSFDSSLKLLQKLLTCEDQHWRRSCRFRIARSRDPISRDEERQSTRQRISDTYSAPLNYRSDGDDLVFDRNFGGTNDAVALPAGWYLIESVISPWMAEAFSVNTNGERAASMS